MGCLRCESLPGNCSVCDIPATNLENLFILLASFVFYEILFFELDPCADVTCAPGENCSGGNCMCGAGASCGAGQTCTAGVCKTSLKSHCPEGFQYSVG